MLPTFKRELTAAMAAHAADPAHLFVGYGLGTGRALGTIPAGAQILETTVAENLMTGLAVGAALAGRRPLVYFERMEFVLARVLDGPPGDPSPRR